MTIDYIFHLIISLGFIFFIWKLLSSHLNYTTTLESMLKHFDDVKANQGSPLSNLDITTQQFVRRVCLTEKKKAHRIVVFSDELISVNQSIEQFMPVPPDQELKSVPGLLTTIGILGTFTGISIGLYELGSGWENSTQLVSQAKELLGGMKTAFFTSLAGMSASAVAMIFLGVTQSRQNRSYSDYLKKIMNMVDEVQPSDLLFQSLTKNTEPQGDISMIEQLVDVLKAQVNKQAPMTQDEFSNVIDSSLTVPLTNKFDQLITTTAHTASKLESITSVLGLIQAKEGLDEAKLSQHLAKELNSGLAQCLPELVTRPLVKEISELHHEGIVLTTSLLAEILQEIKDTESPISKADIKDVIEHTLVTPMMHGIHQGIAELTESKTVEFNQLVQQLNEKFAVPITAELQQTNRLVKAIASVSKTDIEDILEHTLLAPMMHGIQTSNQQLHGIHQGIAELTKSKTVEFNQLVQQLNEKITVPITAELQQTNSLVKDIASVSKTDIEDILEHTLVKPVLFEIKATSQQLSNIDKGITGLTNTRANEFIQLIEQMNEKIVLPITVELKQTNLVVKDFATVSDELNKSVVKTVTEMVRATSTIEAFEHSTLTKLNDFATAMESSLVNFATQSEKSLNSITEKVGKVVELGHQSMKNQTVAFTQLVENSDKTFKSQSDVLEKVGTQASDLIESAKDNLLKGLGDIDQRIYSVSNTIKVELESFRESYQTNLTAFFEQQNTSLEDTLGKQRNSLVAVIEQFKAVFEMEYEQRHELLDELSQQHENLLQSAATIEHLAKAVGLHEMSRLSEIEDTGDAIGRQVGLLKHAFVTASNDFQTLASQMQPQMDSYFTRANKSIEEYFSSFDKVSARIYGRLDSAAELLITAKEEELATDNNKLNAISDKN